MKVNKWTYILFALFIFYLIFMFFWSNRILKEKFNIFYSANIVGKISQIAKNKGATVFAINNQSKTYSFIPIEGEINSNTYFPEFAIVGDSIIKPQRSDTLKLIHKGKSYFYTFQKD